MNNAPGCRTLIHFMHNLGNNNWQIACSPGGPVPASTTAMRTDDPRAVTCQLCMKSNIFSDRMASIRASEARK